MLTELRKDLKNLKKVEMLILDARERGLSFSEQNELQLRTSTDKIIFRCAAVAGCEMPYTELFASVLSEQIISFILKFGYELLTVDEVLLAMEINLSPRSFWYTGVEIEEVTFIGKCVNLVFISKVLANYLLLRTLLDRKIQNHIDGHTL